jgi:glycosyltransferase involved in cell wall biosynthesis
LDYLKRADYTIFLRDNNLICTAGFPTKFSESIACGTPVLTNLTSDLGIYLQKGKNGFALDMSSYSGLVESIYEALTVSREQINNMKEWCRNERTFDYHSFVGEFSKML